MALKTCTATFDAVKAQDLFQGEAGVVIVVPSIPGVNTYNLRMPANVLSGAQAGNPLTFETPNGSVAIPGNMLSNLSGTNGKNAGIAIGQGYRARLTDTEKAAIGDRPLMQLTLTLDGVQAGWNNPGALVTVTIPYTLTAEELKNPESILVWYLDGSGELVCVQNGYYDVATGTVVFTTTHFSLYAVGYNPVIFKDVAKDAWYYKAISFIAARGITSGTANGNYSPSAKLTRSEFIVLMMRAFGIAPDMNPRDNFSDAGNLYYTGYLAEAKRLGISAGIGNNMYGPDLIVSRQEMFTLLYNALKIIGRLPQSKAGKSLSEYSDAAEIDIWAGAAIKYLLEMGIISGSGSRLNPREITTRAEMAQMLHNLLMK